MKRWIALGAALTLGLTACSDPSASDSGTGTGAVTWADPVAELDGVKLTIWAAQNSNTVPKAVVAGFQQATGATVEIVTVPDPYEQSVQTKVATGDKPDLAFWQPTASMLTAINAKSNLQPLTGAPWLSSLDPALKDITGLLDDTRYAALITSPAVEGVYYNKEVFAAQGITATPKNFDEMVTVARTLKTKGVTPFYEMGADRWATQWWVQVQLADAAKAGLWDRINSGQAKFTDPDVVKTIATYDSLIKEGLFNSDIKTAKFEDQGTALLDGKAAMAVQVNSFFGQLQAKSDTATLNTKIGFFPISPSGNVGTFIPDQSNALVAFKTGDTKREAAARQLLAYWMGPGYQGFVTDRNTISLQPAVASPAGVPQALLDVHASLPTAVGSMQALAVANPDLYINLADMIAGTMTPEQVAKATQDQFEQLAKAAGYLK
ncbi:ABC transporter substrate-binding protein [Actinoplanes derwentensis]|uniref:Carbohydrate ABC transporter substrate-binding protein, CUT1 family n=1 Tax=Actinoplanes derwentensis TaxID=113562 RepID=A0A1H1Z1H5_9ACTN|nr:ABC transporter substrate-binding protein [Actinoplanes derwentensis]GID81387.1 sugar ABC transporter substrate-binding protein [Actinoplanes derwentensis]SDT27584.1 carbohydrate ABC transporter substrate-binding protein, CUT1 family [Actinoplanes derwentensis]